MSTRCTVSIFNAPCLKEVHYVDMRRPLSEWYPSWRYQCNLPIWAEQMPIRNEKRCTYYLMLPNRTLNLNTIGRAVSEIQKQIVHVPSCTNTALLATGLTATNWSALIACQCVGNRPFCNRVAAMKRFVTSLRQHAPRALVCGSHHVHVNNLNNLPICSLDQKI